MARETMTWYAACTETAVETVRVLRDRGPDVLRAVVRQLDPEEAAELSECFGILLEALKAYRVEEYDGT